MEAKLPAAFTIQAKMALKGNAQGEGIPKTLLGLLSFVMISLKTFQNSKLDDLHLTKKTIQYMAWSIHVLHL